MYSKVIRLCTPVRHIQGSILFPVFPIQAATGYWAVFSVLYSTTYASTLKLAFVPPQKKNSIGPKLRSAKIAFSRWEEADTLTQALYRLVLPGRVCHGVVLCRVTTAVYFKALIKLDIVPFWLYFVLSSLGHSLIYRVTIFVLCFHSGVFAHFALTNTKAKKARCTPKMLQALT